MAQARSRGRVDRGMVVRGWEALDWAAWVEALAARASALAAVRDRAELGTVF